MWDSYYGAGNAQQFDNNMQMPYPQMGMPQVRYTKSQIIQCLRDCACQYYKRYITSEEKLEDMPSQLRHACAEAGISFLPLGQFPVPEMGLTVPYYFCTCCGKLFYVNDFMN